MPHSSNVPYLNQREVFEEQGQPKGQTVFFGSLAGAGFTVQLWYKAQVTHA